MWRYAVAIIAFAGVGAPVAAQLPNPAPAYAASHTRGRAINTDFLRSIAELRSEYLAVRERNGGTLPAADARAMQQRYDRIYADYQRKIRNINPWSVDASGHDQPSFDNPPPASSGPAAVSSN